MNNLEALISNWRTERIPETIAGRTKRVYDLVSRIYPVSSRLFHQRAHGIALDMADIRDGAHVLEIATGSGEMFSRITKANPQGMNVGIDLASSMAAATQRHVRKRHPEARCGFQAGDARQMPFRDGVFDHVFCCYLLELLAANDIVRTLHEVHRILKPEGRFTLILIGRSRNYFNRAYRVASKVVPAFWGQQVDDGRMPQILEASGFRFGQAKEVVQTLYPSRVLLMHKK
ncbi:MAG: class I SAM-dependent methyltransferase [Bryobacter sp.]|nr:class I SAM-dependent methyltransferase [Bryobacter sp.]